MGMTVAEAIDVGIQDHFTPRATAVGMLEVYDQLPSSVSKEEYLEFVKRNLEFNSKVILELVEEGFR